MRYFVPAGSLVLLLLAGCTRTAVEAPRLNLGPTVAEEYRLAVRPGPLRLILRLHNCGRKWPGRLTYGRI